MLLPDISRGIRQIVRKLGEASSTSDVHVGTTAVNGFEARQDQLLVEVNCHAPVEYDPQGLLSGGCVTESSRLRIGNIVLVIGSDRVNLPIPSSDGISSKPHGTGSQSLAMRLPILVTTPTIINRVSSSTTAPVGTKRSKPCFCSVSPAKHVQSSSRLVQDKNKASGLKLQ